MVHLRSAVTLQVLLLLATGDVSARQVCRQTWVPVEDRIYDQSEAPLSEISSISVDAKGNVAVADDQTRSIILFGPDGRLSKLLGRRGAGPGEFREVSNVLFVGDQIWATDTELSRGHFYRLDGSLARTVTFTNRIGAYGFGHTFPLGQQFVVMPSVMVTEAISEDGYRMPLLLVSGDGQLRGNAAAPVVRRDVMGVVRTPSGGQIFFQLPLPRADYAVVSPGGTHLVTARGSVSRNGARSLLVTRIAPDGDTVFNVTVPLESAKASREYIDEQFDEMLGRYRSRFPTAGAAREAVQQAWRVNPELWPVHGLVAGVDGRVWIRTDPLTNRWLVLDSRGSVQGCADLADNLQLHAAARDHIWGVRLDELGVPSIVRLRIQR